LTAAVASEAPGGGSGVEIGLWPWGILLVGLALYAIAVGCFLAAGRREDARALAGFIPDAIVLVARLARDDRVALPRRVLLLAVVGYLALPIDLIPDFLPVAGQADDAVLLAIALRVLARGATTEMLRDAWPGPEASLRVILRAAGRESNGTAHPGSA
jgi:uncharacterized membrane protein YkvA (DUF1232 family)